METRFSPRKIFKKLAVSPNWHCGTKGPAAARKPKKQNHRGRIELPRNLPRREVSHSLPSECVRYSASASGLIRTTVPFASERTSFVLGTLSSIVGKFIQASQDALEMGAKPKLMRGALQARVEFENAQWRKARGELPQHCEIWDVP